MKGFKILSAIPVDDLWLDPGNECGNNTNAIPAGTKHIFLESMSTSLIVAHLRSFFTYVQSFNIYDHPA